MSENSPPNPGSDEALAIGCKCPVLDNGHGRAELPGGGWWVNSSCPLHGIIPLDGAQ